MKKLIKLKCGCSIPIIDGKINIDYDDLNDNCAKTWKLYQDGHTRSIFQLESRLCQTWSKELHPTCMKDGADLIAVVRPGCVSGSTMINRVSNYRKNGKPFWVRAPLEQIYKNKAFYKEIQSINEFTGEIVNNKMLDIFYTGKKKCFKIKLRKYRNNTSNNLKGTEWYDLECTKDHKLLTSYGWVELKDIKIGDRIATLKRVSRQYGRADTIACRHVKGRRVPNAKNINYFQQICYRNYLEECCLCGWDKANLDVNHINGNRHTDNSPENLCFLCPNCHREFTLGLISKEKLIEAQQLNKLPELENLEWSTYLGYESVGIKDVYDISMEAPHHNFVAGNILVHNCLHAEDENGRSMTKVFCERKNGREEYDKDSPLNQLLNDTYSILVYQEQLMYISKILASFDGKQANKMMKSIGKKDATLLFSLEKQFVDGCVNSGILNREEATEVFNNIKSSARYMFNKSHSYGYAKIGYQTAWVKAHFPEEYICGWLKIAKEEQKPLEEIRGMMSEARRLKIKVYGPSARNLPKVDFFIDEDCVYFGLSSIKNCSEDAFIKLNECGANFKTMGWTEFLICYSHLLTKKQLMPMIQVGCFDDFSLKPRLACEYEYSHWGPLTPKQKASLKEFYLKSPQKNLVDVFKSFSEANPKTEKYKLIAYSLANCPMDLSDSKKNLIEHEKELLGINITCSHIERASVPNSADTCKSINDNKSKDKYKVYSVVGEISEFQEFKIKNTKSKICGQMMANLKLNDNTEELDVVIFPDALDQFQSALYEGNVVLIKGKKSDKGSGLVLNEIYEV